MIDNLAVIEKPLKHWRGLFLPPNQVILNSNLSPRDKEKTLKHELTHYRFYRKHKLLRPFFHRDLTAAYLFFVFAVLCFSPLTYLILSVPLAVLALHEIDASRKAGFKKRILQSVLGLCMIYLLFFAVPLILKFFGWGKV